MTPLVLVPLHGIGTRHDLPLPFSYVVVGASVRLVATFVVLFLAWRRPRYRELGGLSLRTLTRVVDAPAFGRVTRLAVLGLYAEVALALVAGRDLLTNPVFGFVFAWMWVGLVPLSLLLGPFWRATNPLRLLHRGLCRLGGVDVDVGLVTLPAWVGRWPAVAGLYGYGWLELVQPDRTTLPVLRVWALGFVVVMLLGAVLFGSGWITAADPFENYATAVAQLSPWHRPPVDSTDPDRGAELRLVNPLAGLASWRPPRGAAALVSVLLGITAFDSFANTSWWIRTVQASDLPAVLWETLGLLAMCLLVGATFSLAAAWLVRYPAPGGPEHRMWDHPRLLAPSVVPIAIGYAVAHYATLLVVEGQRTAISLSDPLGRGWNLFGSAGMGVDSSVFDHPGAVAMVQLVAILAGHLVGIVAAHELSLTLLPSRAALAGQWPMLLVMVLYTCAGLVLLFSP